MTSRSLAVWSACLAIALTSCVRLGFDRAPITVDDQRAPGDSSMTLDGRPVDTARKDKPRPPDGPSVDKPKLVVDKSKPDKTIVDKTIVDKTIVAADLKKDAPSPGSCAASASKTFTYSTTMVICSMATGSDQCQAQKRCNLAGGWHLCTAAEFLARGGISTPAPALAWIGGCTVRQAGDVMSVVSSSPCAGCVAASGPNLAPVSWECGTGASVADTLAISLGALASPNCLRLGVNLAAAEGYWDAQSAGTSLMGTVCCK